MKEQVSCEGSFLLSSKLLSSIRVSWGGRLPLPGVGDLDFFFLSRGDSNKLSWCPWGLIVTTWSVKWGSLKTVRMKCVLFSLFSEPRHKMEPVS